MMTILICGGLGNQMFQYAAARTIARKSGAKLQLDIGWYYNCQSRPGVTARRYELSDFLLSPHETRSRTPIRVQVVRKLTRKNITLYGIRMFNVFREKGPYSVDDRFEKIDRACILDGYFQNPAYFSSIADDIRSEFQLQVPMPLEWGDKLVEMSAINSVAVHVRRGDYVDNPNAVTFHGMPTLEYYRSAMRRMESYLGNCKFYIFSDDPVWCKANFDQLLNLEIMDTGQHSSAKVMHLMSAAKHQIIANSTFSWWASWLNQNPSKVVIFPEKWTTSISTSDAGLRFATEMPH